jgi:hypothetical protein
VIVPAGSNLAGEEISVEGYPNAVTGQRMIEPELARRLNRENRGVESYGTGADQNSASSAYFRGRVARLGSAKEVTPLTAEELNPNTGKIVWPRVLMDSKYAMRRTELETLFGSRAAEGKNSNYETRIRGVAAEMVTALKANITKLRPVDYMNARKFLDSLMASATQN